MILECLQTIGLVMVGIGVAAVFLSVTLIAPLSLIMSLVDNWCFTRSKPTWLSLVAVLLYLGFYMGVFVCVINILSGHSAH